MNATATASGPGQSWFQRRPRLALCLLAAASGLLTLLGAELLLRCLGFVPGYVAKYDNFTPVDELRVSQQFITDRDGIFKVNPAYVWTEKLTINADGFRGREFVDHDQAAPSILMLGDSFSWGAGADPIDQCFADQVARAGFHVYNAGIPGVGTNQYARLAATYVPKLRPDVVIVAFFLGNDFDLPPMIPNTNVWHITNAGWLYGFDENGLPMDAQGAYEYYLRESNQALGLIRNESWKELIRSGCMRSVIGTYAWVVARRMKNVPRNLLRGSNASDERPKNYESVAQFLSQIRDISHEYQARFELILLPSKVQLGWRVPVGFFEGLDPRLVVGLTDQDFQPDGHFNNDGHTKVAQFILQTLAQAPATGRSD